MYLSLCVLLSRMVLTLLTWWKWMLLGVIMNLLFSSLMVLRSIASSCLPLSILPFLYLCFYLCTARHSTLVLLPSQRHDFQFAQIAKPGVPTSWDPSPVVVSLFPLYPTALVCVVAIAVL